MASYAITINIKHISTSAKARSPLTLPAARAKALSALRYITRPAAAADNDIIGRSQGQTLVATNDTDRSAMLEMSRWAIDARADRHTDANGVRLADTLIVSLPRDASVEHQRAMIAGIVEELGRDSDAWIVAAIHRDRTGNPHAHILAVDGLESLTAARTRRPEALRVRRQDALRLNEGGNREELRERIAGAINLVADREGYRRAEHRSLAAQGIERIPGRHLGARGSARRRRQEKQQREIDSFFTRRRVPLEEIKSGEEAAAPAAARPGARETRDDLIIRLAREKAERERKGRARKRSDFER